MTRRARLREMVSLSEGVHSARLFNWLRVSRFSSGILSQVVILHLDRNERADGHCQYGARQKEAPTVAYLYHQGLALLL
jgi:hypothetical protein